MKQHLLTLIIPLAIIFLGGCRGGMEEFTFTYSVESINNYKIVCSFDSDKTYKIEGYNYFMDNSAGIRAPHIKEGVLTESEYAQTVSHLKAGRLFAMKDAYGFETEPEGIMGDMLYQITLTTDGRSKHITIRNSEANRFPQPFIELLRYINDFLKANPLPTSPPLN
ncbi:MAG: hypothetical protein LBI58_01650 [Tannerellaceae bacterium]|jgi:hypothetical protein|nr:hypothetical protein [Tannerellaceae bacterium]